MAILAKRPESHYTPAPIAAACVVVLAVTKCGQDPTVIVAALHALEVLAPATPVTISHCTFNATVDRR